jgi:hypothetical protein
MSNDKVFGRMPLSIKESDSSKKAVAERIMRETIAKGKNVGIAFKWDKNESAKLDGKTIKLQDMKAMIAKKKRDTNLANATSSLDLGGNGKAGESMDTQ